jgi:RHS repeat-associated protein
LPLLHASNPQKINTIFIQTTTMSTGHLPAYPGGGLDIVSTAAASGAYATASPISPYGDRVFVEVASITNQHKFSITDDVSGALLGTSSSTGSATPVVIPITFTTIPHTTGIRITIECLDPSGTVSKPYRRVPVDSVVPGNIVSTVCNADGYRYGFNGQMKDREWAGLGNHYEFKFRGYDPRIGRFNSADPLSKQFPWNSGYAFAENDVIRSMDLEGDERLIMTSVDAEKRTAVITIKKYIEIVTQAELPERYKTMKLDEVHKRYEKGNTTLYVKELPQNGKPVEFIGKKQFKKGNGHSLTVKYDVSAKLVAPSDMNRSVDGDGGRVSRVTTHALPNAEPSEGARASVGSGADVQVILNPIFNNTLTPEGVIVHEVGAHNMLHKEHASDANGDEIYPSNGLEGRGNPPTTNDTKTIINIHTKAKRVDYEK